MRLFKNKQQCCSNETGCCCEFGCTVSFSVSLLFFVASFVCFSVGLLFFVASFVCWRHSHSRSYIIKTRMMSFIIWEQILFIIWDQILTSGDMELIQILKRQFWSLKINLSGYVRCCDDGSYHHMDDNCLLVGLQVSFKRRSKWQCSK